MASADAHAGPGSPAAVGALVVELAAARPALLGAGRLVCVDGPAGSGKSTLAAAVAARTGGLVVHMDDLYAGWSGLAGSRGQLDTLLRPLAAGSLGRYRRWDWHAQRFAETVSVEPVPWLVLEGVGSGSRRHADLRSLLVWVEAPRDLRLARGLSRDGEALRGEWERWLVAEQALFETEATRSAADVVVDGTGHRPPVVRPTEALRPGSG